MAMKQDTPYRSRSVGEQKRELKCVSEILEHATPVFNIYEAFGGIGMLGQLLSERFPTGLIDSYELDGECVSRYRERRLPNVTLHHDDTRLRFQQDLLPELEMDAASLDFNKFTLLDLTRREGAFQREVLEGVFKYRPKWVHITDSACSKLHLNWRSYGLKEPAWPLYAQRFNEEFQRRWVGYRVTAQAKHSRAAYFLLVSEKENPDEVL